MVFCGTDCVKKLTGEMIEQQKEYEFKIKIQILARQFGLFGAGQYLVLPHEAPRQQHPELPVADTWGLGPRVSDRTAKASRWNGRRRQATGSARQQQHHPEELGGVRAPYRPSPEPRRRRPWLAVLHVDDTWGLRDRTRTWRGRRGDRPACPRGATFTARGASSLKEEGSVAVHGKGGRKREAPWEGTRGRATQVSVSLGWSWRTQSAPLVLSLHLYSAFPLLPSASTRHTSASLSDGQSTAA